jgi:hypothetical protein
MYQTTAQTSAVFKALLVIQLNLARFCVVYRVLRVCLCREPMPPERPAFSSFFSSSFCFEPLLTAFYSEPPLVTL